MAACAGPVVPGVVVAAGVVVKNSAICVTNTIDDIAMITPNSAYLKMFLPVSMRLSSPAEVRYINAPMTSIIKDKTPRIPNKKFKTLIAITDKVGAAITEASVT